MPDGAILALAGFMQSTLEYPQVEVCFHVYGDIARGYYIEDDGISFGYRQAEYGEWSLDFEQGELRSEAEIGGAYKPSRRFSVSSRAGKKDFALD